MPSGFDRNLSRFRVSGKLEPPRLANPCVGATPTGGKLSRIADFSVIETHFSRGLA
jgi:hypothetical protein